MEWTIILVSSSSWVKNIWKSTGIHEYHVSTCELFISFCIYEINKFLSVQNCHTFFCHLLILRQKIYEALFIFERKPFQLRVLVTKLIDNKAISMMRGKTPPSELILEIIKSNNSLRFFYKGDKFIIVKILICLISSHLF